jgi:beta-1,2-mannobiose phosphorylase / 1,2-beta-oligomannan phosphorylase
MSSRDLFERYPGNPILTADDWPTAVNAVFNPAAAMVDGTTVVLARVEDRRGVSNLHVARSADGRSGWTVDPEPLLAPDAGVETEQWGFEDPRTVWIVELGCWAITCTAYGPTGPAVYLATTTDFRSVERIGIIRQPEDKNAALLPERVDGKWILFHRPMTTFGGSRGEVVLSRSDDLLSWSTPEQVLQPRHGSWWDSLRIGIGPPPFRTEHGWLIIYHGVKETVAGSIYRVGLALSALDDPARVLHRAEEWVLSPTAPYEREGDIPNIVFPCGLIHDESSGEIRLYYGAADTTVCLATARLDDLLQVVLSSPPA